MDNFKRFQEARARIKLSSGTLSAKAFEEIEAGRRMVVANMVTLSEATSLDNLVYKYNKVRHLI